MKAYRLGSVLLLACAFLVGSTSKADAALMAYICDDAACSGSGDTVVTDGGAGDLSPVSGSILIFTGAASFEIATSYPLVGTPADPFLSLVYALTGLSAGSTTYLYASQDGFTPTPGDPLVFEADAAVGGGIATAFGGSAPFVPPGTGDVLASGALDFTATFGAPPAPYYLAIGLAVTPTAGAASGDASIQVAVPEPASLALFGLGLFGAGILTRRRMQKRA
jgi:hypothetical protein